MKHGTKTFPFKAFREVRNERFKNVEHTMSKAHCIMFKDGTQKEFVTFGAAIEFI